MNGARKGVAILLGILVLAVVVPARAQIAPTDEQAIQQLVSRLYDARAKKDLAAMSALFAANAPRTSTAPRLPSASLDANVVRELAKQIERMAFPYERLELTRLTISGLKQQATSMTALVAADVLVTPATADRPRAERWLRNMGFIKEGEAWLIWREASAAEDLAVEVSRATTPEEREALLKARSELVSEELALALVSQGERFSVLGNAKGAVAMYGLALGIAEQAKSANGVALVHLRIGQVLQLSEGPRPETIEHFARARDAFVALGDRPHTVNAEIGLATCYYLQDDQASREHYEKAIEILETLPDKLALARTVHSYGNACYMVGDFAAALAAYHRSMSLQEGANQPAGIAALWQAIGRVQKDQRDYDAAIESFGKAVAAATRDYAVQSDGMTGVADVYRLQGRFELALEQYGRALVLSRTQADDQRCMQIEADLGNVYMSAQQPAAALDHYQKSLAIAQQIKSQPGVARALSGAGAAYFGETEYDAALDAYSKALAIRQAKGDIAWLHAHIGLVLSATDRHDEALASFQKALDLSKELDDAAAIAVVLTLLANEQSELDRPDQALELAASAASLARDIESDDTLARAKTVTARVLKARGDREGAARALQEAIAAVEAGRARAGDEPSEDFFGDKRTPYRAMAVLAAEGGKAGDALAFAERAQIGLLADVLTGNRSLIATGLSQAEQDEEQQVARQRTSLRVQVLKEQSRQQPDAARLASLKARLTETDQQRRAFAEKIYAAHPELKLQRGLFEAAPLERLAAAVRDAQSAVLEFVTSDRQTLVLALTRPAASASRAADAASGRPADVQITVKVIDVRVLDLARQVRDFRALIRARDEAVTEAARGLYDLLLQPVQEAIAGRSRLVIVPDGPLWSLPFQALRAADNRYLIRQYAISYAPSLTALDLLSGSSLAASSAAARLRVVAVANRQPGAAAERLKLLNATANLAPIPNAVLEARGLGQIYGVRRSKIYVAGDAGVDAIQADARAAGVLHLATFFVPSVGNPMRSPIVFAVTKTGESDVGEAWQLMRNALPPVTVVSRVQVDRVGGDGAVPVGLSWTLFVGGTKSAVLATWPDDSPAASSLMLGLHRGLAALKPVPASRALRLAILPLLATKYRHPFYWANYAVIGIG